MIALGSGVLQKAGGTFTLTAEVDFGASFGLKSAYFKSRGTNPAAAGVIRLANAESISWRNAANGADLAFKANASNRLEFNGTELVTASSTETFTNKSLSDSTTAIVDVSDATKKIKFDAAGTTGTSTTIAGSQTADRTLTLPDATDTLVGRATTDTFTNKTLTTPVINEINTSTDTNLNLNPNGTGKVVTDNLALSGNTIESTNTNGDLNATANGTGKFKVESGAGKGVDVQSAGHMPIGASVGANDITLGGGTSTVKVPGALQVTGTITGNVTGNLTGNASGTAANVTGTVAIANGGTGQTSAQAAIDALLPTQTTHSGKFLTTDGTNCSWASQASSPTQSYELANLGLSTSVAANAMTVALKQADGSTDPGAGALAVKIGFRNSTSTSGAYNQRSVTSSLSMTISSGATLGHTNSGTAYIWVYALDNSGTVELAVSSRRYDDGSIVSTTAMSGSATSPSTIYSTTARSNVPIRLIGRVKNSQTTAGTYAAAALEVSLVHTFAATPFVTVQKFPSGSGTYYTPAGVRWIRVRMVGGGGGGQGSGDAGGVGGGTGGNTTFGSSLLQANGGTGGATNAGGAGGTASLGSGPIGVALTGGAGSGNPITSNSLAGNIHGGAGGHSAFGGGGAGGAAGVNSAGAGATNTGGGGGGAGGYTIYAGSGGGAGGFVDAIITDPDASYAYSVGGAGSAGGAGTNGYAGAAGGSGIIIVEEHYY